MTSRYSELSDDKKDYYRAAARKYYLENKEAEQKRMREWREANKEYILEKQRLSKRKRKEEAIKYLGDQCMACGGQFHPAVYEFHHRNPKEKDRDPSKMLSLSWKRIVEELNKCDLLCANCHRMAHHSYGN